MEGTNPVKYFLSYFFSCCTREESNPEYAPPKQHPPVPNDLVHIAFPLEPAKNFTPPSDSKDIVIDDLVLRDITDDVQEQIRLENEALPIDAKEKRRIESDIRHMLFFELGINPDMTAQLPVNTDVYNIDSQIIHDTEEVIDERSLNNARTEGEIINIIRILYERDFKILPAEKIPDSQHYNDLLVSSLNNLRLQKEEAERNRPLFSNSTSLGRFC